MFHFRLQTLLHLRLAERDRRRADLAKALRADDLLRRQQSSLEEEQRDMSARAKKLKSPGAANVDALLHTHRYEVVLAARLRQLAAQLTEVAAEIQRRRAALVEADREVRVLEKLRERQVAAERKLAERREARQFDELAVLGFIRQQEVTP